MPHPKILRVPHTPSEDNPIVAAEEILREERRRISLGMKFAILIFGVLDFVQYLSGLLMTLWQVSHSFQFEIIYFIGVCDALVFNIT